MTLSMFLPPYFNFHGAAAFYRTCVSMRCVIDLINYYLIIC